MAPRTLEHAYWLGVRDARLKHPETYPVRPFTSEELKAYRQGYSDQKITDAVLSSRQHVTTENNNGETKKHYSNSSRK